MSSVNLGKLFGIRINLHYTWFFIVILLAWSLATDYFPAEYGNFTIASYWIFGIASAILLFVSVLFHELSHSLIAKHYGLKVNNITLFFFGGIANASDENMTPIKEFNIAIAGPVFSVLFGSLFYLISLISFSSILPVVDYLFKVNIILALFNMIPRFPLDGGRVFRAIVWKITGNLRKATKLASNGGKLFAFILIGLGVINITSSGLWYLLLGVFVYFLAKASYDQVVIKESLSSKKLNKLTDKKFTKVKADESIENFIEDFVKPGHQKFVVEEKGDVFLLDFNKLKQIPRHQWPVALINDVMIKIKPLTERENTYKALLKMQEQGANMLPIVKKKKVIGVITLDTLFKNVN